MTSFVDECMEAARVWASRVFARRSDRDVLIADAVSRAWEYGQQAKGHDGASPNSVAWYAIRWVYRELFEHARAESKRSLTHPRFRRRRGKFDANLSGRPEENPATIVQIKHDWDRFLGSLDTRERTILELLFVGYTTKEIASMLGVTPAAISQQKDKLRTRWKVRQRLG